MQRTLLSSNALANIFLALFLVGAIVFVIGTMLAREKRAHLVESQATVAHVEPEPLPDVETRIDMVERLAMVGQPWCVDQLDKIRTEDPDESVREAADAALMVIGSRS